MNSLLAHEVKDLLSAEKQLTKALPKMAKGAGDQTLRMAFEQHLEETKQHVTRLEQICEIIGIAPRPHKCQAMEGLIAEGSELLEEEGADPNIVDAALIGAAQRVEHYEIAAYGTARAFADQLGLTDVVNLLQQTLDEEGATDKKLNEIAVNTVNPTAAREPVEAEE
jgi:ferritin-like metal-binding protein YciE